MAGYVLLYDCSILEAQTYKDADTFVWCRFVVQCKIVTGKLDFIHNPCGL